MESPVLDDNGWDNIDVTYDADGPGTPSPRPERLEIDYRCFIYMMIGYIVGKMD